jgi:hypothetical protein
VSRIFYINLLAGVVGFAASAFLFHPPCLGGLFRTDWWGPDGRGLRSLQLSRRGEREDC